MYIFHVVVLFCAFTSCIRNLINLMNVRKQLSLFYLQDRTGSAAELNNNCWKLGSIWKLNPQVPPGSVRRVIRCDIRKQTHVLDSLGSDIFWVECFRVKRVEPNKKTE